MLTVDSATGIHICTSSAARPAEIAFIKITKNWNNCRLRVFRRTSDSFSLRASITRISKYSVREIARAFSKFCLT